MTIIITIHTDNAAFEDNGLAHEIDIALGKIVRLAYDDDLPDNGENRQISDSNGNTVGNLAVFLH
jgi:hypothetical protein